jgi:hypothetical protein
MVNESLLYRAGFLKTEVTESVITRLKEVSKGIKILSVDRYCFHKELEEFSDEFYDYIGKKIIIFKVKSTNGKRKYISLVYFEESFEIKNADELFELSACDSYVNNLGFVYVIKSQLGYKIGQTKNIHQRRKVFNVKLPFHWDFELIFVMEDYIPFEKFLHKNFQNKRINGEWFDLNERDLVLLKKLGESLKSPCKIIITSPTNVC